MRPRCHRQGFRPTLPPWSSAAASSDSARPTTSRARGPGRRPGREGRARLRFHLQGRRWCARAVLRRREHRARARAACGPSRRSASEFGQEIDLHQVGYLFLLDEPEHVEAVREERRAAERARASPAGLIEVAEAKALSPLISTDGLLAAAYSPTDGHCTPGVGGRSGTPAPLVGPAPGWSAGLRGRRDRARRARRSARASRSRGRSRPTRSSAPRAPGPAALGAMVGVDLPVEPLRRQILTTAPIAGSRPAHAVHHRLRHQLLLPRRGPGPAAGHVRPGRDARFQAQPSRTIGCRGWATPSSDAPRRSARSGIAAGWAGLYEMTPDHNALIGEADGVSRFLYATGFSGHGFLMGPAVGEVVRDLYHGRTPVVDVSRPDVRRFRGIRRPARAQHRLARSFDQEQTHDRHDATSSPALGPERRSPWPPPAAVASTRAP